MTATIEKLTAEVEEIATAIGVVEHQTLEKGKFTTAEYALYSHLVTESNKKRTELSKAWQAELAPQEKQNRLKKLFKK
jgi:hypothetical protein